MLEWDETCYCLVSYVFSSGTHCNMFVINDWELSSPFHRLKLYELNIFVHISLYENKNISVNIDLQILTTNSDARKFLRQILTQEKLLRQILTIDSDNKFIRKKILTTNSYKKFLRQIPTSNSYDKFLRKRMFTTHSYARIFLRQILTTNFYNKFLSKKFLR